MIGLGRGRWERGWRHQLADRGKFCFALAVGEEPVVANALETVRQHMQEKAANKFVGGKLHLCDAPLVTIVLPGEGHVLVGRRDEAMVGDGDSMGIAGEIMQDLLRPGKRALAIDHPVGKAERRQIGGKGIGVGEVLKVAEEAQVSGAMGGAKLFQEQAAVEAREDAFWEEKTRSAGDPLPCIRGKSATGDEAVNVGVVPRYAAPL